MYVQLQYGKVPFGTGALYLRAQPTDAISTVQAYSILSLYWVNDGLETLHISFWYMPWSEGEFGRYVQGQSHVIPGFLIPSIRALCNPRVVHL
jgi:hypothetical protein